MARLFSDDHYPVHGDPGWLHPLADAFREVGCSVPYFFRGPPSFRTLANSDDLDLLSAEREESWHLSFI